MNAKILACLVAGFTAVSGLAATPAAADTEWLEKIFADNRRAATASSSRASKGRSTARESIARNTGYGGEVGVASYYWQPQAVASGGRFNPNAWTAAHKTLPFGTRVRVTRLDNGSSVDVTINDRGPYVAGRIIDLSRRAAQSINMTGSGVTRVRVNII
jgi:rare lipoprotein A